MKGHILNVFTVGGYGFIRGEDGQDYFFRLDKFEGLSKGEFPQQGRYVLFTPEPPECRQMGKSPRVLRISYDEQKKNQNFDPGKDSGRVKCLHCGKMMVPRLIRENGILTGSVCPFCMGLYKSNPNSEELLVEDDLSLNRGLLIIFGVASAMFLFWILTAGLRQ